MTRELDGSLLVRFEAAGHLEMAWHLYAWGDAVEVVKPAGSGSWSKATGATTSRSLP